MRQLTHGPELDVIDPGANLGWWAQHETQAMAKAADPDDDDEGDDDEDDDDDDDPDEDKTEDELRAELKEVRASLSKASGSSKAKRDKIKALRAELDKRPASSAPKPKSKTKGDDDDDDPIDVDAIREAAKTEGRKAAEKDTKAAKVVAALADAGVDKAARTRLARMIDVDDFELDDDDAVDEAVAELRKDMPNLFAAPRKRRSVAGESDDGKAPKASKPKDASARQASALLGRGGDK